MRIYEFTKIKKNFSIIKSKVTQNQKVDFEMKQRISLIDKKFFLNVEIEIQIMMKMPES